MVRRETLKNRKSILIILAVLFFIGFVIPLAAQTKGLKTISAEDMKPHLKFLSAKEFRGRNAPSAELDIASKYIALMAEKYGMKPLMSNSSYYQEVPVEVSTISEAKSHLRLISGLGEQVFYFAQAFGASIPSATGGSVSGELVLLGYGLSAPSLNWDDYANVDLKGKIAVILDVRLPKDHFLKPAENARLLMGRMRTAREKGAAGVVTVISKEREANLVQNGLSFFKAVRYKFLDLDFGQPAPAPAAVPQMPFYQVDVRHDTAAALLGIPRSELDQMFDSISQGKQVPSKIISGKLLEISIAFDVRKDKTVNVVAYLPGSDPKLKEEYIVIGSHLDHLGVREARIFPGADDNGSGSVAMLELARALVVERPKRSVIFVWHTAEEKGLIGSYYFVQHCPVPVEKISANLNLDMIARNDPNGIYLIGSNQVSTELDKSIRAMNDRSIHLKLDYQFEDPGHPDRFFFRSDQYPYIRYGIPGVWFFCGTTEDYHQETDVEEKADYGKMEKVTRLVYLVAMDIGNKPGLLKLDVNPDITSRGKHNMKIIWQRPPAPLQKR
jgi:hypothetical protein